jgi:hypothetical protein
LTANERWLISGAVGLTLATVGFIELTIPPEDRDDPANHSLSAPLKIALGIGAPLAVGWHDFFGVYATLGILFFLPLMPIIYGVVRWYQMPEEMRERHVYRHDEGTSKHT